FQLLPYLEQDSVFRVFDEDEPTSYEVPDKLNQNKPPARQLIKTFISPADPTAPSGTVTKISDRDLKPPIKDAEYATTSYAVNGMIFGLPWAQFPRTFQDGTSNTVVIAERYQVCSDGKKTVYNLWACASISPEMPSFAFRPREKGKATGQFGP